MAPRSLSKSHASRIRAASLGTLAALALAATEPPPPTVAPLPDTRVYVYPANGQGAVQVDRDRYECHRWASDQSGFDPTQPLGGVSSADADAKRDAYQRAQRACLEGRGYSVN